VSLSIRGISKSFGGLRVLNDVTLDVPRGGLVGLIGPNGAGKSTLFSVVSGFLDGDAGSVGIEGALLDHHTAAARARLGLVRTFQVPREFGSLTVRENLLAAIPDQLGETLTGVFLRPAKVKREEARLDQQVQDALKLLQLEPVADQRAAGLSGGQKKLLELGRALLARPKIILLDEPFAGVNPVLIETLSETIRELNRRGIEFLVIEHDLEALTRLVATLYVMDRGSVLMHGTCQEVLQDRRVREAYLGGTA